MTCDLLPLLHPRTRRPLRFAWSHIKGSDSRKPDVDLDKKGVWGAGLEVKRAVLGALMGPGKIRLKKLSQQDSPHLVHREGSEKGKSLTDHAEKEGNIRGR